ncbi:hypothetical protein ACTXT7_004987 [Hymenolepis weldensis]
MCPKFFTALFVVLFLYGSQAAPVNTTQLKSTFLDTIPYGFCYYPTPFLPESQYGEILNYDPMPEESAYQQISQIPRSGSYVPIPPLAPVWNPPQSQYPVYFPPPPRGLSRKPKITEEEEKYYNNDPTDRMEPGVHYAILKYMPNIPLELANTLYDMEPNYVVYILDRHQYLPQLLMSMDSTTLNYVLLIGDLGRKISQFAAEDVQNLFYKMDSACAYFLVQKPDVREAIVAKAPYLDSCEIAQLPFEINTVKSTPTGAVGIFELADQKKLKLLRTALPTFDEKVDELVKKYDKLFNMNVKKLTAEDIRQILLHKSSQEPFFNTLSILF